MNAVMLQELPPILTVPVFDLDIADSIKCSLLNCMVAKAMFRATGVPCTASYRTIYIDWEGPNEACIKTPADLAAKMRAYDAGGTIEPFVFELELKEWDHTEGF